MYSAGFYINPYAVVFHPELDSRNNYNTIVFNPATEQVLKINAFTYSILKVIDDNPGIDIDGISELTSADVLKITKFLEVAIGENIIGEK